MIFFVNHVWTKTIEPLEYSERQQNTQSYNTIVRLGAVLSPQDQGWCVTRALKCMSETVMGDCRQGMVEEILYHTYGGILEVWIEN